YWLRRFLFVFALQPVSSPNVKEDSTKALCGIPAIWALLDSRATAPAPPRPLSHRDVYFTWPINLFIVGVSRASTTAPINSPTPIQQYRFTSCQYLSFT